MMRAALALLCLALVAGAGNVADEFLEAYRARDKTRQSILAARPAREVSYTLSVWLLLQKGEQEAARALADARTASGGPEGAGLQRLVKTVTSGHRATPEQIGLCDRAELALSRKKPAEALALVREFGQPVEGTLVGVRILAVMARATKDPEAFVRCAAFARAIGWLDFARAAQQERYRLLPKDSKERLAAANSIVLLQELLDDRGGLLTWLAARGDLRRQWGLTKEAKDDYVAAIELAKQRMEPVRVAKLLTSTALLIQHVESRPRASLVWHEEALKTLRKLTDTRDVAAQFQRALRNLALVHTDLAEYETALALWNELLAEKLPDDRRVFALWRHAYVLGRMAYLHSSVDAHQNALSAAGEGPHAREIALSLARLLLRCEDYAAAGKAIARALDGGADDAEALGVRAGARGALRQEKEALADITRALSLATTDAQRGRLLLQRTALERSWGRIRDAGKTATRALALLTRAAEDEDQQKRDYASTAVAYLVLGDLLLLRGETEQAEKMLADGAVFFYRLRDPYRAMPAYVRWTLVLIAAGRHDEALQRLQLLRKMAEGTPSNALKSAARTVDGVFEANQGRPAKARELFVDAAHFARLGKSPEHEATALLMQALLDAKAAPELVDRALALLDSVRVDAVAAHPFVEGERASYPASIAVRALLETKGSAAKALAYMERARADRLQLALRGRAAFLAARGHANIAGPRLVEARARQVGVAGAESAFDAWIDMLRKNVPDDAALAFPRPVELAAVQAALRDDEALLVMLDDPYVERAVVGVTKTQAVLRTFDATKPLDAVADLLKGKRVLIVAPDAVLAVQSDLCVYYVWSAAEFLRLRGTKGTTGFLRVDGEVRCDLGEPAASTVNFRQSVAAGTVVLAGAHVRRGRAPRPDGIAAVLQPWFLKGSRHVVVPLTPNVPEEVWAALQANVEKDMPVATAVKAATKGTKAVVVVYGVP